VGKGLVDGGDEGGGAEDLVGDDVENLTPHEGYGAVLHASGPDLWSLEVPQDSDLLSPLGGEAPDGCNHLPALIVDAVGEVEAEEIDPRLHEFSDHLRRGADRSEGGHDLCFTRQFVHESDIFP